MRTKNLQYVFLSLKEEPKGKSFPEIFKILFGDGD